jgi:hypothetical protein
VNEKNNIFNEFLDPFSENLEIRSINDSNLGGFNYDEFL